jgi:thiol-disulfide isomerase/thioredoxin
MSNIITVISDTLKPYANTILGLIIFFIFIAVGYFTYYRYYIPYIEKQKNSDIANSNNRKKIVNIFFFFVDWCPHCKTAKPEWNNFKLQYDNNEKDNYLIKCYDINCTADNGTIEIADIPPEAGDIKTTPTKITDLIRKYNIEAYPTIKMIKDGQVIEYDAKPSKETLVEFLNTVL